MIKKFLFACWLGCSLLACQSTPTAPEPLSDLRGQLATYTDSLDAQVGIAIVSPEGDTLTLRNEVKFPLMSVFKFHQAVAVADLLLEYQITPEEQICIRPEDLQLDTYSPLRDRFPKGNIELSIAELLSYTLQLSDNLVCDLMFNRWITPHDVHRRLVEMTDNQEFRIVHNEAEMHQHPQLCYENWSSPYAAVLLLQKFLDEDLVAEPYFSLIRQQLLDCQTGANKLPLPLKETGAIVGHKTGTGPKNAAGRTVANNDLGFVILPDGQQYLIAVFVKDAGCSLTESDRIIAEISQITYRYFTNK